MIYKMLIAHSCNSAWGNQWNALIECSQGLFISVNLWETFRVQHRLQNIIFWAGHYFLTVGTSTCSATLLNKSEIGLYKT